MTDKARKESDLMDNRFGTTRIHMAELDREIETIRLERLIEAARPDRPSWPRRARAGFGRGLISLGGALVGEPSGSARTAGNSGPI